MFVLSLLFLFIRIRIINILLNNKEIKYGKVM